MLPTREEKKKRLLTNLPALPIKQQAQGAGLPAFGASPMVERGQVDTDYGLPSENVYRQAEQAEQAYNRSVLPQPAPVRQQPAQAVQPERTVLGTGGDIGITIGRAAIGLPEAFQGLADIVTGGRVGKFTEDYLDYKPGEAKRELSKMYSPAQKFAQKQVSDAKGFVPTLRAAVKHPSTIARAVGESAPMMLGGAGIARGILSKAPVLMANIAPAFGIGAEVLAGAIGEGAIGAGAIAESIREQSENRLLSPKQAAAAVAAGIGTALFSAAGGRIAQKLGIDDIDTMLAGSSIKNPGQVAKAIVYGGVSEGFFEEMPQEMQETVWQNAAMGRPLLEGAAESGAQALLAGAAMGSGANIYSGFAGGQEQQVTPAQPEGTEGEQAQQQAPQQPGVDQDLFDQTRHFLDTGQISPDTERGARIKEHLSKIVANPEMAGAIEANRDIFEAMGVVAPVTPEARQEPMPPSGEPLKAASETGFSEPERDLQSTDELQQGRYDVDLIRARAIQKDDRTAEEQDLVNQDDKRIASEGLAIRRAQAIPETHRTDEEREIVRAEESRAGEKEVDATVQPADVRPEEQAFADLGEGMTEAAKADVAKSIISGKADRLELRRPEAIEAAVKNDDYNVQLNDDGSATIIGVRSGNAWTGEAPSVKQEIPKEASKQIKAQAEAASVEHPAHTSMTQAIKQGGINLNLAKAAGWDTDSLKDIRRPGLFSKDSGVSPDEMAQTLGYESEEAMKNEWVKAPTKKELASSAKKEGEEQYSGIDESVKSLEGEGFDLGSEEKVSVGELSPGDEVVVTDSRGVPEKLTHEGYTSDGNAILKDGQRIEDDPFEELKILAKKTGDTDTAARAQQIFGDILQTESATEIRAAIKNLPAKVKADQGLKPYSDLIEASLNRRLAEVSEGKAEPKARKELLEPISEKEDTPQLDTEKRTRYLGETEGRTAETEEKRRQIANAKKFQETRRDPKNHVSITEQRDYTGKLPSNTERLMNLAAERQRSFNDAKASVDENKEHLVRLFNKAEKSSITVDVNGDKFTVKKPLPGKEQVIMNQAGRDALDNLKQKYKDAGLLSFDYDQGGILNIQPAVAGKSKAAAYGPKTLESAAVEHVRFMQDLARATFSKDAARRRIKEQVISELDGKGFDHAWTNSAKDTTFWVERKPAVKEFKTEEAKEAYRQEREEEQARPEHEKKRTSKLKSAGVSESKALGLKRGEKAERQAVADAELDQILKSVAGTPLPKGQRADIMGELTKQLGRGVLAQQKRGVFEIVTLEKAAKALSKKAPGIEPKHSEQGQRLEGLAFKDGKVWLVDGNIEKGQAAGVLAHELGVHARKLGFSEEKSFKAILNRIEVLGKTDKEVKAAYERVPSGTKPENVNEETLAYLVSDAPQHNLVRRLWSALKRFLSQKTNWSWASIEKFTPADMQAMAQSAIRRVEGGVTDRAATGVNEFAQSAKKSVAQAANTIKGMANFKAWFGDSKVVNASGEPLVVYHGTAGELEGGRFKREKIGSTMELDTEGFFFTTNTTHIPVNDPYSAGAYAKEASRQTGLPPAIIPAYLSIKNPITSEIVREEFDEDFDNADYYDHPQDFLDENKEKLIAYAKEQGHDGITLITEEDNVFMVFEPAQIKSIFNTGEWSVTDPDIMKSYAGEKAATANVATLKEAKKLQQARRNTENLNATKDGVTSTTSAEAGNKAISSMMEMIRKIGKGAEQEAYKNLAKEKKFLDQYREAMTGADLTIEKGTGLLADFARQSDVPPGTKSRIAQLVKQITSAKRPETQKKRLDQALASLEQDISRRLKTKVRNQVKRAAGPKKEGAIKRGRFFHEYEADMQGIRAAVHMDTGQVDRAIDATNARLERIEILLKDAEPANRADLLRQAVDAEVKLHHLQTFGNLSGKNLDELLQAKFQAEQIKKLGRSKLRAVKAAWHAEVDKKTDWLAKEITGQDSPKPETVAESSRRKKKEKGIVGKVKGTYSAVENSIQSWEHLLDRIAIKSGKKIFQSRAVKEFGDMAHAGQRDAEMYNRETSDSMLENGLEIFGVKKGRALTKKLQKLSKQSGEIRVKGDTLQLSPLEAAYLYNVRKEAGSESVFEKMGFTTESFSDMDALMTHELKAWADYLHGDLLAKALQGETEVYQNVNGVTRTPVGLFREGQTEIPIMNLNSAVMNRIFDANHYRAWAVPSKTFNDVFSSPEIRGYIEQHAGTNTLQAMDRFLEDFAKSPRELRGDQAWMDKLRSNVVMSMIGANPTTFFKQLTSIPAYAADIPATAFVGNFAHGLANFRAVKKLIDSSIMAKERFGSGFDRDIHEASKATAEQVIGGKVTRARDVLMSMTKLGDRAAIYTGYTVYKYHNDKAIAQGQSVKEAHAIGVLEFEKATERTQQAAGVKDLGSFQRGGSLQKLFTMYMTSPAAYTRQTMAAIRHFPKDKVGSSKRLLIFNVMLPMMFQAVASGFLGVGGEDEDKTAEFWKKELRAVALGPFMGIPIARDLAAGTWESMMGSWYGPDPGFSPVTEVSKSLTQAIFYASKGLREGDEKATEKAKGEFFDFLGYLAGLPTKPAERLLEGWTDLASGETEHPVMSAIGMSRSARKEKHLDK